MLGSIFTTSYRYVKSVIYYTILWKKKLWLYNTTNIASKFKEKIEVFSEFNAVSIVYICS